MIAHEGRSADPDRQYFHKMNVAWNKSTMDEAIVIKCLFRNKCRFSWQILPKSIFDGVKLGIEKEKLKGIFGAIALFGGKRPTHAIGVAAQGIATVVSEPKFPSCEFLTPGKSFRVCLRHASLKGKDDAMSDFRGASIQFADSDQEDSPLDIIMSTGRPAVLSNVQTIYDALESYRSGNVKEFYLNNPVR